MSRSLRDLMGRNIVIYDLETKVPVDQCSKGWSSMDEMGISVGALFDYRTLRYRIFLQDNMQELIDRLNEANTLIVAFNHIWFDNRLLRASKYALKDDKELNNYDMLVVSRKGANAPFNAPGFKLDDHLEALNLPLKTGSGVNAPIWWQEGKYGTEHARVLIHVLGHQQRGRDKDEYQRKPEQDQHDRDLKVHDFTSLAVDLVALFLLP